MKLPALASGFVFQINIAKFHGLVHCLAHVIDGQERNRDTHVRCLGVAGAKRRVRIVVELSSDRVAGGQRHGRGVVRLLVADLILLLGKQQDIENGCFYDTSNIEAFLIPAGTAVEIYATTLHYAPCSVRGQAFRCAVILPAGTNLPLEHPADDCLLAARNKWLIAHEDARIEGAFTGLRGKNLTTENEGL